MIKSFLRALAKIFVGVKDTSDKTEVEINKLTCQHCGLYGTAFIYEGRAVCDCCNKHIVHN